MVSNLKKIKIKLKKYLYYFNILKPKNAIIEISSYCNAKCLFCPRQFMAKERSNIFMDMKTFIKIVEELKENNIKNVRLYAVGEPSLNPNFPEMINILKDNGFIVEISTNGSNLIKFKESFAKVDFLQLSIEGWDKESYEKYRYPLKFDHIYKNILEFNKFIRNNSKKPLIISHLLLTKEMGKREIEKYLDLWGEFVDYINVDFMLYINYFNQGKFEYKINNYLKDKLFSFKEKKKNNYYCSYPFEYIVIGPDGKVGLCCADFHYKLDLGFFKISDSDNIRRILINKNRKSIQKEFLRDDLKICKSCPSWLEVDENEKEEVKKIFMSISHPYKFKLKLDRVLG